MANDQGLRTWNQIWGEWKTINQEARQARALVMHAYAQCAAGNGAGPTDAQLNAADKLEHLADSLSIELDHLVNNLLS